MEAILAAAAALLTQVAPNIASSGVVALLAKVVPSLVSSTSVGAAINLLAAVVPSIPNAVSFVKEEVAVVKNIIASLRANPATTAAQMDELDAFDARCDAIFDAALDRAEAADAAARNS